ncbi:MAG: SRPBCC domain-containing protein [Actinomycetota bacterium]|nr:SRPBCC domain-containing protein [Actinomycetota bacterium]
MSELRLTRRFAAPPERVFAAWTEPELLRCWWAALAGWQTALAEVDLRPGGRYRLTMHDPATGAEYTVTGEYVDVVPPERLAYTWTWEGDAEIMRGSEGTLVTVDFAEAGEGTEVVLRHGRFAGDGIRDLHCEGWAGCLANLKGALE